MSSASSTVHTCTCRPARCAASTRRASTTRTRPCRSGTCRHTTSRVSRRSAAVGVGTRLAAQNAATVSWPGEEATPDGSRRSTARRRASENDATHTRSHDRVRLTASTSGPTAPATLTSTLSRTSGQVPSTSSSSGTGSVPPMRAVRTTSHGSRATAPVPSVTRSRTSSWKATSRESAVTCTSVSRWVTPRSTAAAKAAIEFSRPARLKPRCAITSGSGTSR